MKRCCSRILAWWPWHTAAPRSVRRRPLAPCPIWPPSRSRDTRAASDQYALGIVVYEWLCGSRPFEGSATEVMVQQLTMPPPPLHQQVATIPLGIEQVVLKALAKDPKERFASVHDFAQALEQASQLAPSAPLQLVNEPPAPGPAAAPGYATVAVPAQQLP